MSTSAGSSAASGVAHGELENEPDSVNAGKKGPLKIAPHPKIQTIYSQGEVPFSVSNWHSDVTQRVRGEVALEGGRNLAVRWKKQPKSTRKKMRINRAQY